MADSKSTQDSVASYKVTKSKDHVDVQVTAGKLAGKSARLIPMPASGAYFNIPDTADNKSEK